MKPFPLLKPTLALLLGAAVTLTSCSREDSTELTEIPEYAKAADDTSYVIAPKAKEERTLAFTDIAEEAGLHFVHETGAAGDKWMPETMGAGGGFLDYDNDGDEDIFFVNGREWADDVESPATCALYRNNGDGTFTDVSEETGANVRLYGMGACFADYDGDQDTDIYITAVGTNVLLRNTGGRFEEATHEAGVTGNNPDPDVVPAWSTGAAWLDVDRDGHLDLFVTNYVKWTPETDLYTTLDGKSKSYATPQQYEGESARLYLSNGDGTFRDATRESGVYNPDGKSMGVSLADFDDNGWIDIAVANDTVPNFLYVNNGDGTFTDLALTSGVAYDEQGRARAGMGIDVADVHNNGRLSLAIGNFSGEPLSLFTQIDEEFFQDLAGRARLTRPTSLSLTFGLLFGDFDLDGYQDLLIGNGHIEPEINHVQKNVTYAQKPQIFLNNREGGFEEVTETSGAPFQEPIVARGLATADIDGDGDLDALVTVNGDTPRLLRNDQEPGSHHWLRIRLRGAGANTDAIGARVLAQVSDNTQRRLVRTGSSYLSQSELTLTFGLGAAEKIDRLEIRWPIGRVDEFENLPANRSYVIEEETRLVKDARTGEEVASLTAVAHP